MSVICDNCGSRKNVRRNFITLWNGNIFDLCKVCMQPMVEMIDAIHFKAAKRDAGE